VRSRAIKQRLGQCVATTLLKNCLGASESTRQLANTNPSSMAQPMATPAANCLPVVRKAIASANPRAATLSLNPRRSAVDLPQTLRRFVARWLAADQQARDGQVCVSCTILLMYNFKFDLRSINLICGVGASWLVGDICLVAVSSTNTLVLTWWLRATEADLELTFPLNSGIIWNEHNLQGVEIGPFRPKMLGLRERESLLLPRSHRIALAAACC